MQFHPDIRVGHVVSRKEYRRYVHSTIDIGSHIIECYDMMIDRIGAYVLVMLNGHPNRYPPGIKNQVKWVGGIRNVSDQKLRPGFRLVPEGYEYVPIDSTKKYPWARYPYLRWTASGEMLYVLEDDSDGEPIETVPMKWVLLTGTSKQN